MGKRRQRLGEPGRLLGDLVLVEETTRLAMPRAPSSAISLAPTSLISSVHQGERENRTDSTDVAGQCSIFSTAIFIL